MSNCADSITAGFDTLMRQAPMTADTYLAAGIKNIDDRMGNGFAKQNPNLLGAFIVASAIDLLGSTLAQQLRAGLDASSVAEGLTAVAESIKSVSTSIDTVAESVETKAAGK